jgi:hypothetical protein
VIWCSFRGEAQLAGQVLTAMYALGEDCPDNQVRTTAIEAILVSRTGSSESPKLCVVNDSLSVYALGEDCPDNQVHPTAIHALPVSRTGILAWERYDHCGVIDAYALGEDCPRQPGAHHRCRSNTCVAHRLGPYDPCIGLPPIYALVRTSLTRPYPCSGAAAGGRERARGGGCHGVFPRGAGGGRRRARCPLHVHI